MSRYSVTKSASKAIFQTAGDVAWTNPANAAAIDSSYAEISLNPGEVSDTLYVNEFGHRLTTSAYVGGIEFSCEAFHNDLLNRVALWVRPYLLGGVVGVWDVIDLDSLAPTRFNLGGDEFFWGLDEVLYRAEVEESAFGLEFYIENDSASPGAAKVTLDGFETILWYNRRKGLGQQGAGE